MIKKVSFILFLLSLFLLSGCSWGENEITINGAFDVAKQDQTTQALEILLTNHIADITLVEDLVLGQKIINISSSIAPSIENILCLKDTDGNIFTSDRIENVTSLGGNIYQIEIKSGVEFAFSTADGCSIRSANMAVDGSINPISFVASPLGLDPNVEWDITRIICYSTGDGVGVTDDKPDLTALFTTGAEEEGVLFRVENNIYYKNIFYANTNEDFVLSSFDYDITDASKFGEYSFSFRKTFNGDDKSGVVLRLSANSSNNQYHTFKAIIERDLTDVTTIECKVTGHETDSWEEYLIRVYGSIQAYFDTII